MMPPSSKLFLRTFIAFGAMLSLLALYQTYLQMQVFDIMLWRSKWIVLIAAYAVNFLLGIWFLVKTQRDEADGLIDRLDALPQGLPFKITAASLLISGLCMVWLIRLEIFYPLLPQIFPTLWVFWWGGFLAALGIRWLTRYSWAAVFCAVLLLEGVLFVIYGRLRLVSDFPFSLGYSESSRYYYGSLLFGKSLYGMQLPLSFLHPTRYFLLAIPFLIPGSSLEFARLWQALLWIGLTAGSALTLIRRLQLGRMLSVLIAAWFFVFAFQGAVYYHLHVMVIIILLGVSARHPWRSLIAVLLASFWAGMSRINWFPVPSMLAAALYFLEEPFDRYSGWWQYLKKPLAWGVLGTLTAFLSQAWYIVWSGNAEHPEFFGSSLASPLLWDRLWPNASYHLGILPGIFLASLPLWLVIYFSTRNRVANVHWLRWLGLVVLTLGLFVGGAIVSVKIGGGAELHNMDAYMVLLSIVAAYLFVGNMAIEHHESALWGKTPWPALALGILVPAAFAIPNLAPYYPYDIGMVHKDLQALNAIVTDASGNNGEVLFITERQLLTYHLIKDVPLVPDYEVVTLMEMAMSDNMDYLNHFYADLHQHRFSLIVARKQNTGIQSDEDGFADENNAWNTMVATQLLCEYQPVLTLQSANIQVFAPRPENKNCP